jgi:nucleoside 2-deoxyribosyltransferase
MLVGLGKNFFGYTNVVGDLLDRSRQVDTVTLDRDQNEWRDSNRMTVENFGNADNLMIDNALIEHGGHAMVRHRAASGNPFYDLAGFEQCLRLALKADSK